MVGIDDGLILGRKVGDIDGLGDANTKIVEFIDNKSRHIETTIRSLLDEN